MQRWGLFAGTWSDTRGYAPTLHPDVVPYITRARVITPVTTNSKLLQANVQCH